MTTDQKINKILEKVGSLEKGQNELTKKFTTLGQGQIDLTAKVTKLDEKTTSLEGTVLQLDSKLTGLNGKVTGFDGKLTKFDGKLTKLEQTQERIVVAIANLQVTATETNERLGDLDTGQNILLNEVDHFVRTIDHHETEIIANHANYMRLEKRMNV